MQKKIFSGLCFAAAMIGLSSCSFSGSSWWGSDKEYGVTERSVPFNGESVSAEEMQMFVKNPEAAAKVFNKRIPPLNTLVVCRDKQCAPAELSMSKEYIFNAFAHLIDNNLDATALLCEANSQSHVCTNPYLTVPAKIGVTPAYVFFDGVKIVDASAVKGKTALDLALGYNLSYNGQTPAVCKPDKAMMYVKSNNDVVLNGNGFKCDMTSIGTTTIRIMFDIDYIDLDYGYIGGYYSIGLSGPAYGGGSGYGLIRLSKDAHPLNPVLMAPAEETIEVTVEEPVQPVVRPEVNSEALKLPPKSDALEIKDEQAEKALAPVEIKEAGVDGTRGGNGALRQPLKVEKPEVSKQRKTVFDTSNEKEYINPSQPIRITPDTIVKSDRVILKPEPQDIRPFEVDGEDYGPEFEEFYVDDLDDYIK